jgi:HEAT repeat protein
LLAVGAAWAVDWKTFDDPKAFCVTGPVAKEIAGMPGPAKAAAMKRLRESLKSKEVEVRRRAALTLGDLGDKAGVPVMAADLATAKGHDRNNVAVALRILKDKRAAAALLKALKDKSPYIRGIAAATLGEMGAKEAYAPLVALTKDKEWERTGGLDCFRVTPAEMACYALGALGEKRAAPVLIKLLDDKDLRRPAGQALEALTKKKFGTDSKRWMDWWKAENGEPPGPAGKR